MKAIQDSFHFLDVANSWQTCKQNHEILTYAENETWGPVTTLYTLSPAIIDIWKFSDPVSALPPAPSYLL